MPSLIKVRILDSRGYPVSLFPVILSTKISLYSGITDDDGVLSFKIPYGLRYYIYFYNPIIGKYCIKTSISEEPNVEYNLEFYLKDSDINRCKYRFTSLLKIQNLTCDICGEEIKLGDKIYLFEDTIKHYECFLRDLKIKYLKYLSDLRNRIKDLSIPYNWDIIENLSNLLKSLNFKVLKDIVIPHDASIEYIWDVLNGYSYNSGIKFDLIAIYPCLNLHYNIILAFKSRLNQIELNKFNLTAYVFDLNSIDLKSLIYGTLSSIIDDEIKYWRLCG